MNTVGSRTRLVGHQKQEKWGADSENLMLLVMQPCTTYLFFCDGTSPRCSFPPCVSFWRTWLCPLRHCCTLQQSALHSDAYVKSSGINVALIYQAISGWVLLFVLILLLVIVFIFLYCIQPTSLFHLILLENSKHFFVNMHHAKHYVTDNLLVIMDSKTDYYYYYLLLYHYSSFVLTKEMLKSLVVKYKYWIFKHATRESFKGSTLAKSSETLCETLNCVISRWLSKKCSDAIYDLHFFPQPNKTIHHFHFRIISNLKLLERLPF